MPFRFSEMECQWNGLPEPVSGLDPGIKPGNDGDPHPSSCPDLIRASMPLPFNKLKR